MTNVNWNYGLLALLEKLDDQCLFFFKEAEQLGKVNNSLHSRRHTAKTNIQTTVVRIQIVRFVIVVVWWQIVVIVL